jgi:replicative DNA helicase
VSGNSGRGRSQRPPNPSKVRPINPGEPEIAGLPCNVDAERFVLGAVLLDDSRFDEVGQLSVEDFSLERHRRILRAMRDLHEAGDAIDRITVANRLQERNEGSQDDFSLLVELDTGIPEVPHLTSWLRILRKTRVLREAMLESHKFTVQCSLRTTEPTELLAAYQARVDALSREWVLVEGGISRVEDLESVFADQSPPEFIIYPEVPAKTLVTLAAIRRAARRPWPAPGHGTPC